MRRTLRPRSILATLLAAAVVVIVAEVLLIDHVRVASGSMREALLVGDRVVANTLVFGSRVPGLGRLPALRSPRPGDVLLFRHPDEPHRRFVKRCAAVAGDWVETDGRRVEVPPGMLYVLGDHPESSWDSRDWGFLDLGNVIGKVELVYWSRRPDAGAFRGARWERIGHRVR